jgi:anaphase-promoting complex subunit 2
VYTVAFQTHVFSALPPSFTVGLQTLIRWTLPPRPDSFTLPPSIEDGSIWTHFDTLGLVDRYESLITGVCYTHIEEHVHAECAGEFAQPMLVGLRTWMADNILPWMVLPFARAAKTRELSPSSRIKPRLILMLAADEARGMLQGIGSRFDFHLCKTLCDLRYAPVMFPYTAT